MQVRVICTLELLAEDGEVGRLLAEVGTEALEEDRLFLWWRLTCRLIHEPFECCKEVVHGGRWQIQHRFFLQVPGQRMSASPNQPASLTNLATSSGRSA